MKKNLFFCFMLAVIFCSGQASLYRPFPTTGNWLYKFGSSSTTTSYKVNGDTTIGTITYKRIYRYNVYKGAVRESAKIVYFLPDTASTEHVLYNFNLTAGSTYTPFGGSVCAQNNTVTVYSIDSVQASDGYHKRFTFSFGVQWIEGVGSTAYLLQPCQVYCVSQNDVLQCMSSDYPFYYGYATCIAGLDSDALNYPEIKVFPSPSEGSVTIELPSKIKDIVLVNSLGQEKRFVNPNLTNQYQLHDLPPGIFIVRIRDVNNKIHTSRIINR
jgi:hypothetical protein